MLRKIEKLTIIVILMGMFLNTGLMASAENSEPLQELDNKQIEIIDNPETKEDQTDIIDDEIDENDEFIEDELVNSDQALDPNETDADRELNKPPEMVEDEEEERLAEHVLNVGVQPLIPLPLMLNQRRMQTFSLTDTIAVDKTAERCVGDCRTFEVSLDITGTPQKAPVDVVLVIDRSGSMDFTATTNPTRTRLFYAKQAAVNFAGRVLGANGIPGSRVAVVSFSGPTTTSGNGNQNQASTDLDLSGNLTTVTNTINAISAVGGTNTEAGFKQGQAVIQGNASNQNPNSNKVVIMLTDGLPTASNGNRYAETTNINHNHIQNAINAGKYIFQNNIADVFTIGLTTGMNNTEKTLADNILTQAQNKGYYPAPQSTDLDAIFDAISQNLGYAATNAAVVDKIGGNFEFVAGSLSTTVGSASENSGTITWNPGTIVNAAQLKYKVVAKDSFVGGMADTNEFAKLTYTNIFGVAGKTKDFPIPEVDVFAKLDATLTGVTINMGDSITLGTGLDPLGENYMSPVTGGSGLYTYEWRIKGQEDIISGDKNPTVSPLVDTEYELTITDEFGCLITLTMMVQTINPNIDIPVEKVWVGPALDSVTITLYKDGIATDKTLLLNQDNEWSDEFKNLPTYDGTTKIIYTVKETEITDYSTIITGSVAAGFIVTNTNIETIKIPVEKIWVGPALESVTITLYKNGIATNHTLLLNESNGWSDEFTNLPKYVNGVEATYTVVETPIDGYTTAITGSIATGFIVTNTEDMPTIDIDVEKAWVGTMLDAVTVKLMNGEVEVDRIDLNTDNDWAHTFSDLAKYDNVSDRNEINYTVEEVAVAGYATLVTGNMVDGFIVTNTEDMPTIDIDVEKAWVGTMLDAVTVKLMNGEVEVDRIDLNTDNDWAHTFSDLAKYDNVSDRNEINYTVEEVAVAGYATLVTGNMVDGFIVTNTEDMPTIDIDVEKAWVGTMLDAVTVKLMNGEVEVDRIDLNTDNDWAHTFSDLAKYDNVSDRNEINYTVEEVAVAGYATLVTGNMVDGFIVTNTEDMPTIDIDVEKAWVGTMLDAVTVKLMNGEVEVDRIDLNTDNDWAHTFSDLAKYDNVSDRNEINYTVEEVAVAGYATLVTGNMVDGFIVTNTETIDIPVNKVWVGPALDSVTVQLYVNGDASDDALVLNAEGNWSATFVGLHKYNADGKQIVYTVEEAEVPNNYISLVTGSMTTGFTVTNTEVIDIPVEKVWIGRVGEEVTINLFADGVPQEYALSLNAEGEWTGMFEDLAKYNNIDGKEIEYTIDESVSGRYISAITGSMEDGFTVTNTYDPYVPPTVSIPVEKVWIGKELDSVTIALYADGELTSERLILNAANNWSGRFNGQPQFSGGSTIVYTVDEVDLADNYTSVVTGSMATGFIVTNTEVYISPLIDITGNKVWILGPEVKPTIQLQLYRDGIAFGDPVDLVDGVTSYTWTNLEKTDADGKVYVYTIDEVDTPENYDKLISEDGLTVTNIFFEVAGEFIPDEGEEKPVERVPITGIANNEVIYLSAMILSLGALLLLKRKKRI